MILVRNFKQTDGNPKSYYVEAFSDTKEEVTTDVSDFHGLPADAESFEPSSYVRTANCEIAFMKSDGTWNWVS